MRTKLDERYDQPAVNECSSMKEIGSVMRLSRKELGYSQSQIVAFAGCSGKV